MTIMIKDLKKNDRFKFNNKIYTVEKRWWNEDSPMRAMVDNPHRHPTLDLPWQGGPDHFDYEELEVDKIEKAKLSERDTKGKLYVDCVECERGHNGSDKDKCSAGQRHKKGHQGGCFIGVLLNNFEVLS